MRRSSVKAGNHGRDRCAGEREDALRNKVLRSRWRMTDGYQQEDERCSDDRCIERLYVLMGYDSVNL